MGKKYACLLAVWAVGRVGPSASDDACKGSDASSGDSRSLNHLPQHPLHLQLGATPAAPPVRSRTKSNPR